MPSSWSVAIGVLRKLSEHGPAVGDEHAWAAATLLCVLEAVHERPRRGS
jgi:hypothetical protein